MPGLGRQSKLTFSQEAANRRVAQAGDMLRRRRFREQQIHAAGAADRQAKINAHLAPKKKKKKKKTKLQAAKARVERKRKKTTHRQDQVARREASREGVVNRRVSALEREGRTQGGVVNPNAFSKVEPDSRANRVADAHQRVLNDFRSQRLFRGDGTVVTDMEEARRMASRRARALTVR